MAIVKEASSMKASVGALFLAAAALMPAAHAQDVAAGAQLFRTCHICHRIGEGAKNMVGPELNGLDGRHSGVAPGYHYSQANEKSGIVWNEATFTKYIKDPQADIPGTKMAFAGIKNPKDIANLWAYIKQFGPDGKKK
jgi:cytochrome c